MNAVAGMSLRPRRSGLFFKLKTRFWKKSALILGVSEIYGGKLPHESLAHTLSPNPTYLLEKIGRAGSLSSVVGKVRFLKSGAIGEVLLLVR
jgi:hypothetical protein